MMPWPKIEDVCARMERGRALEPDRDGSSRWICRCPAHDDGRPSLMVIESIKLNGRPIFKCYAGCEAEDVCRGFGFIPGDERKPPAQRRKPKPKKALTLHQRKDGEEYEYRFADGSLNFVVTRREPKDFRQHRVNPQTGEKVWNLTGVNRTLYRLEKLARDQPKILYVVEGEVDVLNLEIVGCSATTKAGGGGTPWEPLLDQLVSLGAEEIRIVADLDEVGLKSASSLRDLLYLEKDVRSAIYQSADGDPGSGADVSDHLTAGFSVDELVEVEPLQEVQQAITSEDLTEFGAALYLERSIGSQVMYVPGLEEPWHYEQDGIWVADRDEVDGLSRVAFSQRIAGAEDSGGPLLAAAKRYATVRGIESALKLIRNSVKVPVRELGELKHPNLIAVKNGVLNLENGALTPPDPSLRFTMRVDQEYLSEGDCPGCPRWLSFLEEVQPDPSVRSWLQMLFGACLSGEMPQIVICNIGGGLNGKSVAINTVMSVLGDYAGTADSSTFMSGRSVFW